MKKMWISAFCVIIFVAIGISLINVKKEDTDVTKKMTKVGVIMNGPIDDMSWGQSHYEGMEEARKELNLKVYYEENVPEDESAKKYIEKLVDKGCKIIVCDSFGYGESELAVAKEHPEVYFFHATGTSLTKNLSTYFGRAYQMRYLSGIVAGMQTKTNEIGYVAAYPISEVIRGINAFTLGVRLVNPDAVVKVIYTNDWADDEVTATATETLFDENNIDVVAMHTDSHEVLKIAEERGIWSIGYHYDNAESYPNTYLTSIAWDWGQFYTDRILECLQGKFVSKNYWEDQDTGIVTLSDFTDNVDDGIKEVVEKEKEKISDGTFDVFYGPIKDNEGNIRIAEGESMSDYTMLNNFDWYVEGVEVIED